MRGRLSRRRLFPLLAAAIASVARASTLDELLVESARCDALASGQEDGEVCAPEHHTDILIELGDAHLELEEWKEATEAYKTAGMVSFEHIGVDSREHGAALLRLATAQLYSGEEYRRAYGFLRGWLSTGPSSDNPVYDEVTQNQQLKDELDELDALMKQAEAAALGGMLALAKAPLDAVLEKVENATTMGHELGDIVGRFGTARVARAHLMMAGVLPGAFHEFSRVSADQIRRLDVHDRTALQDLTKESALEQAIMHVSAALELHQAAMDATEGGGGDVRARDDDESLNAGGAGRRRESAREWAGPGQQVEMSMCANLKASLLHESKAAEANDAAAAAMEIQSAAAAAIGYDLASTAEALKEAKGDMSKITASMEAVGVAMFEAFKEHLRKEGRSATAAAALASFFGDPSAPREAQPPKQVEEEEVDDDQAAMENALKGEL